MSYFVDVSIMTRSFPRSSILLSGVWNGRHVMSVGMALRFQCPIYSYLDLTFMPGLTWVVATTMLTMTLVIRMIVFVGRSRRPRTYSIRGHRNFGFEFHECTCRALRLLHFFFTRIGFTNLSWKSCFFTSTGSTNLPYIIHRVGTTLRYVLLFLKKLILVGIYHIFTDIKSVLWLPSLNLHIY